MSVKSVFEKIIVQNQIQAVHSNTIMLRECLDAAKSCNIPGIVHVRELVQHDQALLRLIGETPANIIAETIGRAHRILANSSATAKAFNKPGQTFVVQNTVDIASMDLENKIDDNEVRFGLISSNIIKRPSRCRSACRLASKACPEARFLLIGPETELTKRIQRMKLDGTVPSNILLPGYAEAPKDAISKVNIVLNFSHFTESFGRTILEAMAARRPVIAYRWGALPELIEHEKTGYLVPFKAPERALKYVEMLCKDKALIRRLGEAGRRFAIANFSTTQYANALKQAYADIFHLRHRRTRSTAAAEESQSGDRVVRQCITRETA